MIQRWRLGWVAVGLPVFFGMACLGGGDSFTVVDGPDDGDPTIILSFQSFDLGALHSCALTFSGDAYCWGANGLSQLGVGDVDERFVPSRVVGGVTFDQISAGGTFTCGVAAGGAAGGQAFCWGSNQQGQLGQGLLTFSEPIPVSISTPLFTTVSAGGVHACGLAVGGQAWCWGTPTGGRLGNGDSGPTPKSAPDSVLGGLTFTSISAGSDHTCGLTANLEAYCWGIGTDSQLGNGTRDNRSEPTLVSGNLLFEAIDAGGTHTCGVVLDGEVYCWGLGVNGQLGVPGVGRTDVPLLVSGGLFFQSISVGGSHTCAISGSEAYCWGVNDAGQLGDGTTGDRDVPTLVAGNIDFQAISAGGAPFTTASCGLSTDLIIFCWGFGGNGQLGDGVGNLSRTPVRVSFQRSGGVGTP